MGCAGLQGAPRERMMRTRALLTQLCSPGGHTHPARGAAQKKHTSAMWCVCCALLTHSGCDSHTGKAPPSHRGENIRYSYKVCAAFQ